MKKIMMLCVVLLIVMGRVTAQTDKRHALGVHWDVCSVNVEYHYIFATGNYLMVTAGMLAEDACPIFQGQHCWNIKQWDRNRVVWNVAGGVGGTVGGYDGLPFVGPAGMIGGGLKLKKVPLTFEVDFRPMTGFVLGNGFDILDAGFLNIGVTVLGHF